MGSGRSFLLRLRGRAPEEWDPGSGWREWRGEGRGWKGEAKRITRAMAWGYERPSSKSGREPRASPLSDKGSRPGGTV